MSQTDPFAGFADPAARTEPDVPDAMQIATVDAEGHPRVRTVLLKDHGPHGFTFYTNLRSAKGHELCHHPRLEAVLHWKSLARQARFAGPVSAIDAATADAYFASRPRGSQIGAWASRQSEPLDERLTLQRRVDEVEARFAGQEVPRPPFWGGYRVAVDRLELWQGRSDRLHDRAVWTRDASHEGEPGWRRTLLYP
jgi:pyridoxamine 5'-phosphate oxidase